MTDESQRFQDHDVNATLVDEESTNTMKVRVEEFRLTEMGILLDLRSSCANVMIEIDMDYLHSDPEYVLGLLQVIPNIIDDQYRKLVGGEDDAAEHPAVQQGPL